MKIAYRSIRLQGSSLSVVTQSNAIIEEYSAQGFDLTLRQLFLSARQPRAAR